MIIYILRSMRPIGVEKAQYICHLFTFCGGKRLSILCYDWIRAPTGAFGSRARDRSQDKEVSDAPLVALIITID